MAKLIVGEGTNEIQRSVIARQLVDRSAVRGVVPRVGGEV